MTFAERMERVLGPARAYIEGLSDRERRLLLALGVVAVAVFVLLPMYLVLDGVAEREEENRELIALLREFDSRADELRRRQAERDAVENLFRQDAPALGGFLETQAHSNGLELREVTDQPDQDVAGFIRHRVSAQIPNAGIEPMMRMLEAIENSQFPVTVSRIEADRAQEGKFNFRLGVDSYSRGEESGGTQGSGGSQRRGRER